VKQALQLIDRANYVDNPAVAYMDAPQSIGYDQTISAPHMHSHALEEIVPTLTRISRELEQQSQIMINSQAVGDSKPNNDDTDKLKILDVGCGSGYLTSAFGRLVDRGPNGPIRPLTKGKVWGIDVIPELVALSRRNIMKADSDLIDSGTVTIQKGDGWNGLPEEGPFHAIHVGAAAESFPTALMMQLYPHGGVMVVPVGANYSVQNLYRIERLRDGTEFRQEDFHIQNLLGVRYVSMHGLYAKCVLPFYSRIIGIYLYFLTLLIRYVGTTGSSQNALI
jgi:protein-L-isoaspartate(D-aspartate) O-methyltransferase